MNQSAAETVVVRVDNLLARALELDGRLSFHCPLLEDPRLARAGAGTGSRYRDLAPVLTNPRAGVLAAVRDGRTLAYAVFGPPSAFRRASELPFVLDEDALLIAALYAAPEAREDNLDVDLLLVVLEFAREQGYASVQALGRDDPDVGPEARVEMLAATGFQLSGPQSGRWAGLRLGSRAALDEDEGSA
ncbi:MAG: hypothetical protein R6X14_08395 [bacterium]